MILRDVEVDGVRCAVHVEDGVVVERGGGEIVDGGGGALIPGIWDHHIHLRSLAALGASVDVSGGLDALPRGPGGWVRAVGFPSDLDRAAIDCVAPDRPVRVQHRSGALWVLNTRALEAVGLDPSSDGRLFRADAWLRDRLPAADADLSSLRLERYGIVGVTDMTPYDDVADLAGLGAIPQRVVATGSPRLAGATFPSGVEVGPVKIVLSDHALPSVDDVVAQITAAHGADRPVAVHCITRIALALLVAALDAVGGRPGDRVEHGAVVPPDLRDALVRHRLTVVTQPAFVRERGDDYLRDADADDVPHLYPCASLPAVAGSTDAPYATADPWVAIAAAVDRRTASGAVLGAAEAISPRRALGLFLGAPEAPGGPERRIEVGAPADLCLLDAPLVDALAEPSSTSVIATYISGVTAGAP